MDKRWVLKKAVDKQVVNELAVALGIDTTLAQLLVQRGVTSFDEAKDFFRPDLSQLHDPFLLKDMDLAVDRLQEALQNKEKVLIYGDYDVDGTTAVSLLYTFLKEQGFANLDFYIPDRYSEGYGVSAQGVDFAVENDFKLVIALDCGIKAVEKIADAKKRGVDFIVCDHHRPGDGLPGAVAVLDPKRADSEYPFNELSGCGVGFKLIQAYSQKKEIPFESLRKYLDLVTISIASDIVSISGENRILAYYGLRLINSNPRPGIEAILKVANLHRIENGLEGKTSVFSKELTISDLVFVLGPRINAAGRIESGRNSVLLLTSETLEDALLIAQQIDDFNTQRRDLDTSITQQALDIVATDERLQKSYSTVVYNPNWHKGVIGIVASRLAESYYRPTIVLTESNGLITGSARSVKNFDIYQAIDACNDLLEHFGGHMYAAGLSLKPENLDKFCERFEKVVSSSIQEEMRTPEVEIDAKLNFGQIDAKFLRILKQFAPFGPDNMSPIFITSQCKDTGFAKIVGKNHLKMTLFQESYRSAPYAAIAFQQADKYPGIQNGKLLDVCYHIDENEWNGQKSIQLVLKDISFNQSDYSG